MNYFLKKTTPAKKGLYLQIYVSTYIPGKGKRNRCHKTLGYVRDLVEKGIEDPIAYYQAEVDRLNEDLRMKKTAQAGDERLHMNLGYFLPKAMFDLLNMDDDINAITYNFKTGYKFSDMLRALCCAAIVNPEYKKLERTIRSLYGTPDFSAAQTAEALRLIGLDYHKFVEVLNRHIEKRRTRRADEVYLDLSSRFLGMETFSDDSGKRGAFAGQALMLDEDRIPLDMELFPEDESGTVCLEKTIADMKERNRLTGKVIRIADVGGTRGEYVRAATKGVDGYVLSAAGDGAAPEPGEEYVSGRRNGWTEARNPEGALQFSYKITESLDKNVKTRAEDTFSRNRGTKSGDEIGTESLKYERRILMYDPESAGEERGESGILTAENPRLAGYHMLISSGTNADPGEICKTYRNMREIKDFIDTTCRHAETAPEHAGDADSVYGRILVGYIAMTIMRLLESEIFRNEISASRLIGFVRDFNISKNACGDVFTNCCDDRGLCDTVGRRIGAPCVRKAFLTREDVNLLTNKKIGPGPSAPDRQ